MWTLPIVLDCFDEFLWCGGLPQHDNVIGTGFVHASAHVHYILDAELVKGALVPQGPNVITGNDIMVMGKLANTTEPDDRNCVCYVKGVSNVIDFVNQNPVDVSTNLVGPEEI